MTTAFVLSGGASLGAVQVGMARALLEHGIKPDLLVGTSVGALNAAFLAGRPFTGETIDDLADTWEHLSARQIFPLNPLRAFKALLGRPGTLCSSKGVRALLEEHLTFDRLEDATVPLTVVATDFSSGMEVRLDHGDALTAILASSAIPAIFPPITVDGRPLVDGAFANNTAFSVAIDAGADTTYVLPSGYSCAMSETPDTLLGSAAHAMAILIHQRLLVDIATYGSQTELTVLPPPCPIAVSPASFAKSGELIDASYREAKRTLNDPARRAADPAEQIAFHEHHR